MPGVIRQGVSDAKLNVLGGLYLEGLIHGGAYFRNFTVFPDSGFHNQKFVGFRDQDSLAWSDVVEMSHLP